MMKPYFPYTPLYFLYILLAFVSFLYFFLGFCFHPGDPVNTAFSRNNFQPTRGFLKPARAFKPTRIKPTFISSTGRFVTFVGIRTLQQKQ